MSSKIGYPNRGRLGAAIRDFKKVWCSGLTRTWPLYWEEFAAQAFTDLMAMELEKKELEEKLKIAKKALSKYATNSCALKTVAIRALREIKE